MKPDPHCDPCFPDTRWTLISRLRSGDESVSRPALSELCTQYHFPLYCFIRRRGLNHHDAEDALQDFFAKLLRLDSFASADPEKGRLRSYLATALHRFLIDWRKNGHLPRDSNDFQPCTPRGDALNLRYERESGDTSDSPETILDRRWAHELMTRVLTNLRETQTARGKGRLYDALLPVLLAGGRLQRGQSAELAAELGISEGNVRISLSRFLRDYRDALEAAVLETVPSRHQIPEEISYLLSLFSRD
ncbi:MAG: sigma-70 family RNA polymerase sigma factor [Verrucomicrobia bacterium]|nr:sigma-70 family RNA polymerase sigma factor [Verrucomicrobiota bacterium]